jgi:hypothetical protein
MAWLRTFDAHPVWAAFHTVATARAVDYFGAQFRLPLPDAIDGGSILRGDRSAFAWRRRAGVGYLGRVAWYNTSRAALRLAERKPEEAEGILRETVSVGLNLVDEDPGVAAAVVREGRRALEQLARLTGRTVPGLVPVPDALTGAPEIAGPEATPDFSVRRPRADILAGANDTLRSRIDRYRNLLTIAEFPCSSAREMIFGPDPDALGAFATARRTLARFPSDSARIDVLERIARGERPAWTPESLEQLRSGDDALFAVVARWLAGVSARILGAPRIAKCMDANAGELRFLF